MVKRIFRAFTLLCGIFLLADGLFLVIATNLNTGTILVLLAGAFLTVCSIWSETIRKRTARGFGRVVKYAVLAMILLELCLIGFLAFQGHRDMPDHGEDAVIVLGAAVHGDQVSRSLARRLDKAVEYYGENPNVLILVSGGKGPQETVTEASAMEAYLRDKGIPAEKIAKEEKATSTYENFFFSKQLLDERFTESYDCVYITNTYHLYRAGSMAELAGIKAVGLGASSDWYYLPAAYLRESLATVKFWVLKR